MILLQLNWEYNAQVGNGSNPDLIHFPNGQSQLFYLKNGSLYGKPTEIVENGEWGNVIMQSESEVSPDSGMSYFHLDTLPGFGAIGGYHADNKHKLIIYEFMFELDIYLNNGSITHSIDNPISSFTLTLENADSENPEHPGNVAMNEETSLLSPGAKVSFKFSMGDSQDFDLGTFYVDRSNFILLAETATVDGRNLIGKALKDQTLNEMATTDYEYVDDIIKKLLQHANIDPNQYEVQDTNTKNWFEFKPNIDVMAAFEEIFKAMINWRIKEEEDGIIVIGAPSFNKFRGSGMYYFYRNQDIFSREIAQDDMGAYRRVCVHDKDFNVKVYKNVETYTGWNLQSNKTLFVQVVDGTRQSEAEQYANEVASRLEQVGKVETFMGPIRPHIMPGDGATIMDNKGNKMLGLITEVTHNFGKKGFITEFTVDSGGRLGKGRLSDYISRITRGVGGGSIGYEDFPIIEDPPEEPPEGE